jgi:radical SAM superfamily enzyme YgiQ (UPF0313 family)
VSRPLRIHFILPALTEAQSPFFRPIKYSLFPPLGLATLAGYCDPSDVLTLTDEHVEILRCDDAPDLVVIQVYITNAWRAYEIADLYRARGCLVALGGLHVTSLPDEAALHADAICCGPGEEIFPRLLADVRAGRLQPRYSAQARTLLGVPPIRRDLIQRSLYLVPNSIVVTRGCPHHCDFCYKDAFFAGGKGFYTQTVDAALAEIERLPGRHLYFLDDHVLGHQRFAQALFAGMRGMGRLFQGASTVDAILRGDTIEHAASAGLRSIFIGFESLSDANLAASNKTQNLRQSYQKAIERLHGLGVAINGSFVFGLDDDREDVFERTVEWAVRQGLTTATFHVATPYPGTAYHARIEREGRLLHQDWRRYDTRQAVFTPRHMSPEALERGYWSAYSDFYRWSNIARAASHGGTVPHRLRRFAYAAGWKKFEPLWDLMIRTRRLAKMLPLLEGILDRPAVAGGKASARSADPQTAAAP